MTNTSGSEKGEFRCRTETRLPFRNEAANADYPPHRREGPCRRGRPRRCVKALPGAIGYAQAQSSEPIRIGFQVHRTGIGAAYGRWYERTTTAAAELINANGGIGGRPIEIIAEDDGTDPKRGAEVVEKFATQHKVDVAFGTLFSHVVMGSAPRAGELKLPYYVVSEGYHVASGALNRYTFQPGITDVRSQVSSMAPWIASNLGKKVTMMFPDYAFGYDHRDYFSAAIQAQGGPAPTLIPIPPTESSFTRYFPQIPADTEVLYHVMVGPAVLTFVKELGEHFGSSHPQVFGFIDSLEATPLSSPGLEFLEGTYFWEAYPRYAGANQTEFDKFYRDKVGVDANGASTSDAERHLDLLAHVRLLGDALRHQAGDGGGRLQVRDRRRQEGADRGDRGDRRRSPRATSIRRATRLSTEKSTSALGTRTSRRWKAASSTSCTARRSRMGSTSRRRTTRRWRFDWTLQALRAPSPRGQTGVAVARRVRGCGIGGRDSHPLIRPSGLPDGAFSLGRRRQRVRTP